jgi:hypothetical protein
LSEVAEEDGEGELESAERKALMGSSEGGEIRSYEDLTEDIWWVREISALGKHA